MQTNTHAEKSSALRNRTNGILIGYQLVDNIISKYNDSGKAISKTDVK